MNFSKVNINGYELPYQPTTYDDAPFDSRQYKRSVDGTLVQISGVIKKQARFSGVCEADQLVQLESYYENNSSVTFSDPRGNTWTAYIVSLEKTYSDKVRAEYRIEVREV